MKIDRLKELKQKLTKEKDLSVIWEFYMDHFADHREFTQLGNPAYNEHLNAILGKICQQLFTGTIIITDFLLIYVPEYQMFHGPFQIQGCIGGVIYFDDLKMGLIAVSGDPETSEVKYSRFTQVMQLSGFNRSDRN